MNGCWIGIRVRKGNKTGTIVGDSNWYHRLLTVNMDDGTREEIILNNFDKNPESVKDWEWLAYPEQDKWIGFRE